ncbi:hypothetical protein B296_00026088 [Ensete ventricosum]|uniref:Uncharacterized protein n=1 Tax=Ensete ventricosum TaxID=4639 RepID=A0A427AP87_ENSVE|nr:hypothetical protein B296_00026088 [Ensete ventricosum]
MTPACVLRGNADGKEAFRRFAALSNPGGAPAGSGATVATGNAARQHGHRIYWWVPQGALLGLMCSLPGPKHGGRRTQPWRLDRVRGVTCEEPLATAALKDPPMAAMGKGQWQGQGQSPSHVTPGLASGPPILTALASQVMAANPGHYVAVIIVAPPPSALNSAAASSSSTCNDGGARVKHLRLLRANDTLHIGHVYRLVSFQGGGGSKSSYRAGGGGARDDGGRNHRRRHPDNEGQSWWSSIGTPWAVEASLAKHCRVRKLNHPSRLFQSICVGKGEAEVAVSSLSDVLPATGRHLQ